MTFVQHQHPCAHCLVLTECCGDLQQNHDGWPEIICVEYHDDPDGFLCDECAALEEHGQCEDCGTWYSEPHHPGCDAWKATN